MIILTELNADWLRLGGKCQGSTWLLSKDPCQLLEVIFWPPTREPVVAAVGYLGPVCLPCRLLALLVLCTQDKIG